MSAKKNSCWCVQSSLLIFVGILAVSLLGTYMGVKDLVPISSLNFNRLIVDGWSGNTNQTLPSTQMLIKEILPEGLLENTAINSKLAIHKRYFMYNRKNSNDRYAVLCGSGYNPNGNGNALGIYWYARSIAFFSNYMFIMGNNIENTMLKVQLKESIAKHNKFVQTNHVNTSCKRKNYVIFAPSNTVQETSLLWTWFLPLQTNATFENMMKLNINQLCKYVNINCRSINQDIIDVLNSIDQIYNDYWKMYLKKGKVPYTGSLAFMTYNPIFLSVVASDTNNALNEYFRYISLHKDKYSSNFVFCNKILNQLNDKNTKVIAIHLRLGDILHGTSRVLLNLKYYDESLKYIFDSIEENDSKYNNNINNVFLYIITQFDTTNVHNSRDLNYAPDSATIAFFINEQIQQWVENYKKESGDKNNINSLNIDVNLIGNNSMNDDHFILSKADYVICSVSSFCLMPAFGNNNAKLIIFPQGGSWAKIGKVYKKMAQNNKYLQTKHHKWIDIKSGKMSRSTKSFAPFNNSQNMNAFKKWFTDSKS